MKILATMLFILCVVLGAQAQERAQPQPSTSPAVNDKEPTKGEVDLAIEELKKHGESVFQACACENKEELNAKGVLNGRAEKLVVPSYPAIARSAHASGAVHVMVLIDKEGTVQAAQIVDGNPLLAASALRAARDSRFSPTLFEGKPQHIVGIIVYNFHAQ